jgi:Membrane bound beta barrel domain (DUF5777)
MRFRIPLHKGLKLSALFVCLATLAYSQPTDPAEEDLLSLLGTSEEVNYTTATFKTTRIINMHSVEQAAPGVLDFRINHRFGFLNGGPYEFFGLDQALMRLGFEYGITDRLMVGVGRSNVNKAFDAFAKFKILRQSTGGKNMPISLSYFTSIVCNSQKFADPNATNFFTDRLYYTHQLLIARKFNNELSLQLTPTFVHSNLVANSSLPNDVYAMGFGGRYKLTQRFAINGEYIYVLPNQLAAGFYNSLSAGVDIDTGGHIFQLQLTNSTSMVEPGFITQTVGQWKKGGIHFGFNVSRVFTVHTPKKAPTE